MLNLKSHVSDVFEERGKLAKKLLDNDKLQLGDKQICLPNVIIIVLNENQTIIFPGISLS